MDEPEDRYLTEAEQDTVRLFIAASNMHEPNRVHLLRAVEHLTVAEAMFLGYLGWPNEHLDED